MEIVTASESALLESLEESIERDTLQEMGIPPSCLPPITRGFPRLIGDRDREYPQGYFCDLASLKRTFIDKALLHLYTGCRPPLEAQVVIFTWVIGDGYGDYAAQLETARIVSSILPPEAITLITILWEKARFPREKSPFKQHILHYRDQGGKWREIVCAPLSEEIQNTLHSASLILQIPTHFPLTEEIIPPGPKYELVGEGGWLDTPHYNPLSGARCMGLHSLEKGIYIKEMPSKEEAPRLLNSRLAHTLFGQHSIEKYLQTHSFNCAYTYPEGGLYLYIHTLLISLEEETRQIDIALFNLSHILTHLKTLYLPLFQKAGVKEVEILFDETSTTLPVAPSGKRVRLIHLDTLSNEECLAMVAFSDHLVGCKADGSLSEAVSASKPFFLDPPNHKLELTRDLIALAKHHFPTHSALHNYLEIFLCYPNAPLQGAQALLALPYLQELGDRAGSLLKEPSVRSGLRELCHLIHTDYAVNPVLQNLTLRSLIHKTHPHIEVLEKHLLNSYLNENQPLHSVFAQLKAALLDL